VPTSFAAGLAAMLPRLLGPAHPIVTRVSPDAAAFMADPAQLEAAVVNLCINARDALPGGGQIALDMRPLPPDAAGRSFTEISVTDHGTGMDAETQARAFEPFFTTKPVGKGTGLGLSMVMGFVRQSGGTVQMSSAPGEGTRISLALPVAADAAAAILTPAPAAGRLMPIEVLVVDERDDMRDTVCRLCRECGLQPTPAKSAAEALSFLQAGVRFRLLFASLSPAGGMSGADLAGAARLLQSDLAVLLSTGADEVADPRVPLLRKPYTAAEFIDAVRSATGQPSPA
jgi:CheY-like chemotaxis protein/anti-sigma regulatory factor (Ser/Thr protein kinase)